MILLKLTTKAHIDTKAAKILSILSNISLIGVVFSGTACAGEGTSIRSACTVSMITAVGAEVDGSAWCRSVGTTKSTMIQITPVSQKDNEVLKF